MKTKLFLFYSTVMTSISGALQDAFTSTIQPEVKGIVNNVVFPIIDAVLIVVFIIRLVFVWRSYKQGHDFEWGALAILFVALVICLSAPTWIWSVIGW